MQIIRPQLDEELRERFRLFGIKQGAWTRGHSFFNTNKHQLFFGVNVENKSVLDIGCGNGQSLLWAALSGARQTTGLEPITDGSSSANTATDFFLAAVKEFQLCQTSILNETIQNFVQTDELFDIVILKASINHLDEDSCISLRDNKQSAESYLSLFGKIRRQMKQGAELIITDCSCNNLFASMGIKNPFHPHITWSLHQSPNTWVKLLSECGFSSPHVCWLTNYKLSYFGVYRIPSFLAYLTWSEFRLKMEAQ